MITNDGKQLTKMLTTKKETKNDKINMDKEAVK